LRVEIDPSLRAEGNALEDRLVNLWQTERLGGCVAATRSAADPTNIACLDPKLPLQVRRVSAGARRADSGTAITRAAIDSDARLRGSPDQIVTVFVARTACGNLHNPAARRRREIEWCWLRSSAGPTLPSRRFPCYLTGAFADRVRLRGAPAGWAVGRGGGTDLSCGGGPGPIGQAAGAATGTGTGRVYKAATKEYAATPVRGGGRRAGLLRGPGCYPHRRPAGTGKLVVTYTGAIRTDHMQGAPASCPQILDSINVAWRPSSRTTGRPARRVRRRRSGGWQAKAIMSASPPPTQDLRRLLTTTATLTMGGWGESEIHARSFPSTTVEVGPSLRPRSGGRDAEIFPFTHRAPACRPALPTTTTRGRQNAASQAITAIEFHRVFNHTLNGRMDADSPAAPSTSPQQ